MVDGLGHNHTVKNTRKTDNVVVWRCTSRKPNNECSGKVWQSGTNFTLREPHTCDTKKDVHVKLEIVSKAKTLGLASKFVSATAIVEPLLKDKFEQDENFDLPNPSNIARVVNRIREKNRPKNPIDLGFTLKLDNIPVDFYKGEVKVGKARHLIFSTTKQLQLMAKAPRWYCDGTFKLVKKPFVQMFSFHGMLRKDEDTKQFPFLYVLMSRRTAMDYEKVLKKIKSMLRKY